ncbi:unnamed protein product [Brassica napus]|uniref:(rape) hypothetical protein n=1 Tax=Brassica napus TaxID=3708 RepID=A0A816IJD0_BRANA|nr:unnamed protein product [Brassica napus]
MATRAAPLSDSRVRPTSFFSAVRESLSSGSRREESICRVSIASFDLCFNDLKRLRLQLHGVKPLLKSITHDLDYNASFSSQGFDVTRCNQNFQLLDSSLLIRFRDTNSLDEVTEPVKPNVVFERGLEGLLDNSIFQFLNKATDLIDEDGSLVRPCHAQIPEEARELEKQLRQIT